VDVFFETRCIFIVLCSIAVHRIIYHYYCLTAINFNQKRWRLRWAWVINAAKSG